MKGATIYFRGSLNAVEMELVTLLISVKRKKKRGGGILKIKKESSR
jgi:hypothetical protein